MKKFTTLFVLTLLLSAGTAMAQRYAIIDTRYILDKMPDYGNAQKTLDATAELWQREIDNKQTELDKMYRNFDAERVMLTPELVRKREDELFNKEKEVRDLQKKRFGFEGEDVLRELGIR